MYVALILLSTNHILEVCQVLSSYMDILFKPSFHIQTTTWMEFRLSFCPPCPVFRVFFLCFFSFFFSAILPPVPNKQPQVVLI